MRVNKNICSILGFALLLVAMQFLLADYIGRFEGTDDKAIEIIQSINPNYTPWMNSWWELKSENTEMFLFALQTFIGVSVIVLYVVYNENKRRKQVCKS